MTWPQRDQSLEGSTVDGSTLEGSTLEGSTVRPGAGIAAFTWSREPTSWFVADDGTVTWTASAHSDFWRYTGGVAGAHDGNALLAATVGDFAFSAELTGMAASRYDQYGVFIEVDESHWIKAGVEYDGGLWLSTVATADVSDWSIQSTDSASVRLRATRTDDTVRIFVHAATHWRMIRELTLAGTARVGCYSCSPQGEGFVSIARMAFETCETAARTATIEGGQP